MDRCVVWIVPGDVLPTGGTLCPGVHQQNCAVRLQDQNAVGKMVDQWFLQGVGLLQLGHLTADLSGFFLYGSL